MRRMRVNGRRLRRIIRKGRRIRSINRKMRGGIQNAWRYSFMKCPYPTLVNKFGTIQQVRCGQCTACRRKMVANR